MPLPFLHKIQKATDAAFSMLTKTCKNRLENFSQKKGRESHELCSTDGAATAVQGTCTEFQGMALMGRAQWFEFYITNTANYCQYLGLDHFFLW